MTSIDQQLSRLIPSLISEPSNPYPETADLKDVNHFGWVETFTSLIEVERKIIQKKLDPQLSEKVQQIFDRFLKSMVAFGFGVNKNLVWQFTKPLHHAAASGCLRVVRALIQNGATVNIYSDADNKSGSTPLWEAVCNDHLDVVEQLIAKRADITLPYQGTAGNCAPLLRAQSPRMCQLLVEQKADVNEQGTFPYPKNALNWAVESKRPDTVQVLLGLGAKQTEAALALAKRVHQREVFHPEITRLTVSLLENPQLGRSLSPDNPGLQELQKQLNETQRKKRQSVDERLKEYFIKQAAQTKDERERKFHQIAQEAQERKICFSGWKRNDLTNLYLATLRDYFSAETGEHLFGKEVRELIITDICLIDIIEKDSMLTMPNGISYICELIARNPSIESIDLRYTQIGDEEALKLIAALEKNTRLKFLHLEEGNRISPENIEKLNQTLEKNWE